MPEVYGAVEAVIEEKITALAALQKAVGNASAKIVSIGAALQDVFLSTVTSLNQSSRTGRKLYEAERGAKADVNNITYDAGFANTLPPRNLCPQGLLFGIYGYGGHDLPAALPC